MQIIKEGAQGMKEMTIGLTGTGEWKDRNTEMEDA